MNASPIRAVFVSYTSQDAEVARRVATSLRAAGVEVWFDENELVGGDAWDAKIRTQIRDCALFLPLISAHTQARREGYFRLEWKLADERTHLMAEGTPFLLPIVTDATKERDALVPKSFLAVQWTRLPDGETPPAFGERVQKLLALDPVAGVADPGKTSVDSVIDLPASARPATPRNSGSGLPKWVWGALALIVVVVVGRIAMRPQPTKSTAPAVTASPPTTSPAAKPPLDFAAAKSIAVLPFKNLSPDKENEFFADGVQEDVLTSLAKIRDLKVISQTSVLAYRDQAQANLKKIATELGVATVLKGSVRRAANRVKVTAQLIDARTDEQLWANDYERELTDVFAIQATIAQEIAAALKATLLPGERAQIARPPTQNLEAYDLFIRARQALSGEEGRGQWERYEQVIKLSERAVALDPNFAAAYVPLARAHGHMHMSNFLDPSPEHLAKLKSAVDAATRIEPELPESKIARGIYHYFGSHDFGRALQEFRAAQAGLPNDSEILRLIADTERRLGRWHEALANYERSAELDPRELRTANTRLGMLAYLRRFSWPRPKRTP